MTLRVEIQSLEHIRNSHDLNRFEDVTMVTISQLTSSCIVALSTVGYEFKQSNRANEIQLPESRKRAGYRMPQLEHEKG